MNKRPKHAESSLTPYANFLYLLAELERSVDLGTVQWPVGAAEMILSRIGNIAQKVALAMDGHRPTNLH